MKIRRVGEFFVGRGNAPDAPDRQGPDVVESGRPDQKIEPVVALEEVQRIDLEFFHKDTLFIFLTPAGGWGIIL